MDLLTVLRRFPDQEACIEYLEQVCWRDRPCCALCGSVKAARMVERVGSRACYVWESSFDVLSRTTMAKTRVPLQKSSFRLSGFWRLPRFPCQRTCWLVTTF